MTDVVLFHHIQGLTPGMRTFAERLASSGHTVHTPDLYSGRTFNTLRGGLAYMKGLDAADVDRAAQQATVNLHAPLVYVGVSWGVSHAQRLAQTTADARGALFFEACFPLGDDGFGPWPPDLPVQVHGMDNDEFFAHEGDLDAARNLVATVGSTLAEVFTYPGDQHLFLDSSLPSYDPAATDLAIQRAINLLDRIQDQHGN